MSLFINGRFTTQHMTGVQRFCTETTRALQLANKDYTLLTPRNGAVHWKTAKEVGTKQGQIWEQFELPPAVKDGFLLNLGNTAPLSLKNRQLVVIHDTGVFQTPQVYSWKFKMWYKFLQKKLVGMNAGIVTVSEFSKTEIMRFLGAKPEQIWVVPEGADHMHDLPGEPDILTKNRLELRKYVLCVGTQAQHKNVSSLSVLAEKLGALKIPLVIAGGNGGNIFKNSGDNLPTDLVKYVGRVSDGELKSLYQAAAVFVFPSLYEGYGLPPIEAMACGCPTAVANIPVLREVCGTAAAYFNPASPEQISNKIIEIVNSSSRQEELRGFGQLHTSDMTWNNAAAKLDRIAKTMEQTR